MRVEFNQKGTWQAKEAAEAWCQANGISVGQSSADGPSGLLFGDYDWIAKWRNLTPQERANLHGTMDGEFREGPVIVTLKDSAVEAHAACLKAETTASAAA
jgi:hypothetical protein